MIPLHCLFHVHCSWSITKEDMYPFISGATGAAGACNKALTASIAFDDKVQLVGSGFKQLRQWSAAALREVGHSGVANSGMLHAIAAGLHGPLLGCV